MQLWGTTASNYLNEAAKDVAVMVQIGKFCDLSNGVSHADLSLDKKSLPPVSRTWKRSHRSRESVTSHCACE